MSRSGYFDCDYDYDNWAAIRYSGMLTSSIRGKRGQKLLCDLRDALERMPEKRLIAHELQSKDGAVCALGALGRERGINMQPIDPEDAVKVAAVFDVATPLAREIVYQNDEAAYGNETPEARYQRVLAWVQSNIREEVVK